MEVWKEGRKDRTPINHHHSLSYWKHTLVLIYTLHSTTEDPTSHQFTQVMEYFSLLSCIPETPSLYSVEQERTHSPHLTWSLLWPWQSGCKMRWDAKPCCESANCVPMTKAFPWESSKSFYEGLLLRTLKSQHQEEQNTHVEEMASSNDRIRSWSMYLFMAGSQSTHFNKMSNYCQSRH